MSEPDAEDYYDGDFEPPYRDPHEIEGMELGQALKALHLLGDDMYLRMQAFNLSVVDKFIMGLEYDTLQRLLEQESTPAPEAMFLSAQSQMWIFAAYELMRTWRERAKDMVKLAENGGLALKLAALEVNVGYLHVGRDLRANQIRALIADRSLIDALRQDLRATHIPFARIEFIRVALAKHQVSGNKKSIAFAPGYGRITQWCGALDYQMENGGAIMGYISRRDVAEELRAMSDRSHLPSDQDLASFDAFMKGPPSNPFMSGKNVATT